MPTRRSALAAGAAAFASLSGCIGSDDEADEEDDSVKVAWVYDEPVSDIGWTNTYEETREVLENEYDIETTVVEDIAPGDANETFTDLARDGYDIIEAATFDYGEPAAQVIEEFDDVFIETPRIAPVEGYETHPQKGYYLGRLEEPCYVLGRAAGMVTETDTIGLVQSFDIPSTVAEANAIYQGAQSVNPDVDLEVITVNTWFDPPTEVDAAEALVENDADVLSYRVSTANTLEVAADEDVWGFAYADEFKGSDVDYEKYISSRLWNWVPFFGLSVEHAIEGTLFDEETFDERFDLREEDGLHGNFWGFEEGGVDLGEIGDNVPEEVETDMMETVTAFEEGDLTGDDIYEGTMYEGTTAFERATEGTDYVAGIEAEEE